VNVPTVKLLSADDVVCIHPDSTNADTTMIISNAITQIRLLLLFVIRLLRRPFLLVSGIFS
jgi:hypothetical protein